MINILWRRVNCQFTRRRLLRYHTTHEVLYRIVLVQSQQALDTVSLFLIFATTIQPTSFCRLRNP